MKKAIFFLAIVSTAHLFSMDILTQYKMKSVVIQIASNTVDSKTDPTVHSTFKEDAEVKKLDTSQGSAGDAK